MTEATETKLSQKSQSILTSIETLTVLELAELVKALEEKFGVSAAAAAPVAVAVAGGAAAGGAAAGGGAVGGGAARGGAAGGAAAGAAAAAGNAVPQRGQKRAPGRAPPRQTGQTRAVSAASGKDVRW